MKLQTLTLSLLSLLLSVPLFAQNNDDEPGEVLGRRGGSGYSVQYQFVDLTNYASLLGPEAAEALERSHLVWNSVYASYWKKFNMTANFGYGLSWRSSDTVRYRALHSNYNVMLGRSLINSRRFLLTPQVGLAVSVNMLQSSAEQRIVPLTTLLQQPNVNLHFWQVQALAGLQMALKIPQRNDDSGREVWLTARGAYYVPLSATPWIYSGRNRVTTDLPFETNNLMVEMGILFMRDPSKRRFNLEDLLPDKEDTPGRSI